MACVRVCVWVCAVRVCVFACAHKCVHFACTYYLCRWEWGDCTPSLLVGKRVYGRRREWVKKRRKRGVSNTQCSSAGGHCTYRGGLFYFSFSGPRWMFLLSFSYFQFEKWRVNFYTDTIIISFNFVRTSNLTDKNTSSTIQHNTSTWSKTKELNASHIARILLNSGVAFYY